MSKNKIYKEYKKGVAKAEGKIGTGRVIRRILLSFFTFIILLVIGVYLTLYVVAKGPSETIRNMLVLSAKQASATKWIPSLFLDEATIDQIVNLSTVGTNAVRSLGLPTNQYVQELRSIITEGIRPASSTRRRWRPR